MAALAGRQDSHRIRLESLTRIWLRKNSTAKAKNIVEQPDEELLISRVDEPQMLGRKTLGLYVGTTFAVEFISTD